MASRRHKRTTRKPAYPWARLRTEKLLDLRFRDLRLRLENTPLAERVEQLYDELAEKGLRFRPHCWLSNEWFAPEAIPGIAIPFYLAHPRLSKLEDQIMLEVEGGTRRWCMQLLRHEAGHAYETAYRLARRAKYKRVFGDPRKPYPDYYKPRPVSKKYVLHLDWWYAQSHPCEDFAETFAVWLTPRSQWRRRYHGWPALAKLEYVDELMSEIARRPPLVRSRRRVDPVSRLETTLRDHYDEKRARYGADYPDFYDRDLRRLFPSPTDPSRSPAAAAYLRRLGPKICREVASWTGEYTYTVNRVLKDMIQRCRELDLRVSRSEDEVRLGAVVLLTMQTMDFLYRSDHKIPL